MTGPNGKAASRAVCLWLASFERRDFAIWQGARDDAVRD